MEGLGLGPNGGLVYCMEYPDFYFLCAVENFVSLLFAAIFLVIVVLGFNVGASC